MISYAVTKGDRYDNQISLNPYCSGRWSRTWNTLSLQCFSGSCLNPYCSGRWSRTLSFGISAVASGVVLILIVLDNGLVLMTCHGYYRMIDPERS